MKKRSFFLFVCLALLISVAAHAQVKDDDDDDDDAPTKASVKKPTDPPAGAHFDCPYEKDFRRPRRIGAYMLRLAPRPKDESVRCRAVLISAKGTSMRVAEDWALTVDKISGTDINADGQPELVVDGYSGGAQGGYTYTFVTLGASPRIVRRLSNHIPITFEKNVDGVILLHSQDGVFDYFLVPHRVAVIPAVVLKMEGDKLMDVSAQFPQQYDEQISRARSELTAESIEKFRQANYHDKMFRDQFATAQGVLTIVLNYLYSGRQEKAWQALNELWPASDQARVKSLIIERRGRGLLQGLGSSKSDSKTSAKK
jgi:hypothetical protein